MSTFKVEVFKPVFETHPNADRLSIVRFKGWTCVCNTQDFVGSELAAYVPLDSVVPDTPEWAFMKGRSRVKTAKIRGIVSQGLLIPGKDHPHWQVGDDVAAECGIVKYEEPEPLCEGGEDLPEPARFMQYTDIENIKGHMDVLRPGEPVHILEKVHGSSCRFGWIDGEFCVGSRTKCKKRNDNNLYWRAVLAYPDLPEKMAHAFGKSSDAILYAEVIGVQDLKYGRSFGSPGLAVFDFSWGGQFHPFHIAKHYASAFDLPVVTTLHEGPFDIDQAFGLAEGKTTMHGCDHVREGVVVRPISERWDDSVGRVILKIIGNGYAMRKGGTEHH